MKKFSLLLIFVFGLLVVQGQTDFRFGLSASPLSSWNKADAQNIESDGANIGFQYGILADLNFEARYAVSTGLLITHSGGNLVTDLDSSFISHEQKLQYIEVPVTLKLKTNQVGYLTYYGQFGFTPSVPIRKRADITEVANAVSTTTENVELENINNYNLALTVGAGIEYAIDDRTAIVAGLVFNNGFTNVVKDGDGEKISLSYIAFRLGVFF